MERRRPDRCLGPGHDEFWSWCKAGELRLQRCEDCGHMPWPVVQACERCGGRRFVWDRLTGRGKILSWCRFEHDYYRGMFTIPYDTILVELEEGPLFISNPDGFACDAYTAGMAVEVKFVDAEDSQGLFRLPVFTPG